MTTGAGLYLHPTEEDNFKQNYFMRQLAEGRSNAVGSCTLSSTGTITSVIATTIGPNSFPILAPKTAHAAALIAGGATFVSSVIPQLFYVTHTSTGSTDLSFWYFCVG